ncbi:hypothetical protein BVRB_8g183890 [Beta vulgaris subsp. vulgaris]|nr:hypothetical protein BVRB_8g183890 [Beta vulgaris subsp. vulgaris]
MGTFYSAGRDPIFYAHHSNVDRLWSIWKNISPRHKDFKDKDFLNSDFYFYDEDAQPLKICVRDVLDTKKLGYDYQPMDLPWLKSRPFLKRNHRPKPVKKVFSTIKNAVAAEPSTNTVVPKLVFPKPLNHIIRTNVERPSKSRTQNEKDDEEEILVIEV